MNTTEEHIISLYKSILAGINRDFDTFDLELNRLYPTIKGFRPPPPLSSQSPYKTSMAQYNDFTITDESVYCITDLIPNNTVENDRRRHELYTVYNLLEARYGRDIKIIENTTPKKYITLRCKIQPIIPIKQPRNYFENLIPDKTVLSIHQKHILNNLSDTDPMYLQYTFLMRMLDIVISDYPERYKYYLDDNLYWTIQGAKIRGEITNWSMPNKCNEDTLLKHRGFILANIDNIYI